MLGEAVDELDWSTWVLLEGARRHPVIPDAPGLYRIRSIETGRMLYVRQAGRALKERLGSLAGVSGEAMPNTDPHTAGPALWAHRADTGETFEVSVAVLEVDKGDRMGREALEVTKQRIIDGCSPAYNFGRMPHGWLKSCGDNRQHIPAGKRFRGRRMTPEELAAAGPDQSVPPPVTLEGDVRTADWVGLALTAWQLLEVENDLIAGHMVEHARPPRLQFGPG